jgi:type IX secretion system PorP/SprF family membrane protein
VRPGFLYTLIFLIHLWHIESYAQDFHFSGFMYNQVYCNPGYAGMSEMNEVSLTYRNQWPGIPAHFVTSGASFIQHFPVINSSIGVSFLNDTEGGGVISKNIAGLQYGYSFKAGKMFRLSAGIGVSYVSRQFDPEGLVFASDILNGLGASYAPANVSAYTIGYPDFSAGIMAGYSKEWMTGFSVSHLTRPMESFSGEAASRLPVRYNMLISYKWNAGGKYNRNGLKLTPALLYVHQGKTDEVVWGTSADIKPLTIGAFLRHNLTMSFSSLLFSAGIIRKKYTFFYNYDVNLTRVNFLSTKTGAHEVTFLLRFEYKRRKHKTINCPL